MNWPSFQKQRLVRSVAGTIVVLTYGVIMALTANHALTQADPVPQRTWEPRGKAVAGLPNGKAPASRNPNLRSAGRISPIPAPDLAELRKSYLLLGHSVLGADPADGPNRPWPHTGEFIDDCSVTLANDAPMLFSM